MSTADLVIGIVGPSKSGKSTLKFGLEALGYKVKHIAQEHSFVPSMWQKIANPDILIFLDVNFENTMLRGQPKWEEKDYNKECSRLLHARDNANLMVDTNHITPEETLQIVRMFLSGEQKKSE